MAHLDTTEFTLSHPLLSIAVIFSGYLVFRWWKNPIRRIPGPAGIPLFGNALSIDGEMLHMELYKMAREYGPVTKIYIFNTPFVVLNTKDVCLEALVKKDTDFNGRPHMERVQIAVPRSLIASCIQDPQHQPRRRIFTKAMKAYGPGIGHLENIMQETMIDIVDEIQRQDGEAIKISELCNGYVCCVIASLLFGEKYSYNDPTCQFIHQLNLAMQKATDPYGLGQLIDMFPFLSNYKFILSATQKQVRDTAKGRHDFLQGKIDEAKKDFDKSQSRGCLDLFIQIQQEELDENGQPKLDDLTMQCLMSDFFVAGMETSFGSLSQAFLDLLHYPDIAKRIQAQIDEQFEPKEKISIRHREKLPLLEAFIYENLRYLSVVPLMIPHRTIRDTEVAGYEIPANTRVLLNNFHTSHDPDVYEDPFTFKLERFLDDEGKIVPIDHPMRQNLLSFGSGRRQCPGEVLAQSRIFLFLANILQKFDIEPVGKLPDRDVRSYKMGVILAPPSTVAKFVRRQQ